MLQSAKFDEPDSPVIVIKIRSIFPLLQWGIKSQSLPLCNKYAISVLMDL